MGVIVGSTGAFVLSCRLSTLPAAGHERVGRQSLAGALASESRLALSGHFYEMADLYFHCGVEHIRDRAFEDSIWQRTMELISPVAHVHRDGQSVKEIMPWLWMAIRADPHNVQTYLVAAYWLANEADRPDLALSVLDEARWQNPGNCEIQIERGRICLALRRIEAATHAFDAALAFWPGHQDPADQSARHERATALLYRALLHELAGENDAAVRALQEHLSLFPDRTHIAERIRALEKGEAPSRLASEFLDDILRKYQDAESARADEEDGEDHGCVGRVLGMD